MSDERRIATEWATIKVGDLVLVRGSKHQHRVERFGNFVSFDQDNRPHREESATVSLVDSGREREVRLSDLRPHAN